MKLGFLVLALVGLLPVAVKQPTAPAAAMPVDFSAAFPIQRDT
jgi:hypothetical protein